VDVAAFEEVAVPALSPRAGCLYLIDEIGRMELFSKAFVEAVETLLSQRLPLVATVAEKVRSFALFELCLFLSQDKVLPLYLSLFLSSQQFRAAALCRK
jgi:nucleoside-triphosphatase THEP1